jgi:hypothetical protein
VDYVTSLIARLRRRHLDEPLDEQESIVREWDRQRARATSAADLAEIDQVFSRYVA